MKKTLLLMAFLLVGFFGFGQVQMPYFIQYNTGNDTVYHRLQTVESIHVDAMGQELTHGGETEWSSLLGMDTVYVFRDKFKRLTENLGDWDEVFQSSEQIYFYKGNEETGQPQSLLRRTVYQRDISYTRNLMKLDILIS